MPFGQQKKNIANSAKNGTKIILFSKGVIEKNGLNGEYC